MNWKKLLIPIALGVLAAGLNYAALSNQTTSASFIVLKENIKAGQLLEPDLLERIELPGNLESLSRTAVPYSMRQVLEGRPVSRDLEKGDLVLWRDTTPGPGELTAGKDEEALPISLDGLQVDPRLLRVGDEIGFLVDATPAGSASAATATSARPQARTVIEYVGPFRILSVGDVVQRRAPDQKESSVARTITVALKRKDGRIEDDSMRKFLEAKWAARDRQQPRILEVVLRPRQMPAVASK